MSCRKRASPISPLRHGFRARSLLYCPAPQRPRGRARAAKREARVRYRNANPGTSMGATAEPGREGDCPPRETGVAWGTGVARETDVAWETNVAQETRVADLAATARLSRPQPFVLPPCRSDRGAAPGRRSVRRGFDTATPTPGLPWARRRSRGGKATALLGKQASHEEQASRGKQASHGKQTSRRKRASPISPPRHGFRARSLLYCPAPQRSRGPARAAGPGLIPQRQPRGFHERAAEPGREGDCPPSGNKCHTGNRRRMGNKCRAGNKRLAGNTHRRSRRCGTAFAPAAFCIAPRRSSRGPRPGGEA